MKNKHIIVLFILGMIITIFGSLLKILHFEIGPITGNFVIVLGTFLELSSGVFFIFKLLKNKKNDFLNQ